MEPNYMIVVIKNSVESVCYGPFDSYKKAWNIFHNNKNMFGVYEKDTKVFLTPISALPSKSKKSR